MLQSSRSISKGIAYLTTMHVSNLSCIEQCFFASAVQGVPGLDGQRQKIITNLTQTMTADWLQQAPLAEVFSVVNTLHHHKPSLVGGEQLALLVTRLLQAEQSVGGPYSDTKNVDIYTNAVIANFASWAAGPLPKVNAYIAEQVRSGHATKQFTQYQSLLDTKHPSKQFISKAVKAQLADGSWEHDTIATALMLQKLSLSQGKIAANTKHYATSNAAIFAAAHQESAAYSPHIQPPLQTMLKKLDRANKRFEITMLATYFSEALTEQARAERLHELGLANLYGWLAYTLYDDILDHEDPGQFLSLANISMRRSYLRYLQIDPAHTELITHVFNQVDQANAWELAQARATVTKDSITLPVLPRYGNRMQLAYRSYIHVLGPFLLAAEAGLTQKQQQKLQLAWRHYLIGRQLNDDLHDWQEDLQSGQLTYVVCALLRDHAIKPGTYSISDLLARLRERFVTKTVQQLCLVTTEHMQQATTAFAEAGVPLAGTELQKLCAAISNSAMQTQALQKDSLGFREHFKTV